MNLKEYLPSSRTGIVITGCVSLAIGAALVIAAYCGWDIGTGDHDKGITVTLAATLVAAVLAAVATVLALIAYWAATATPKLSVELKFHGQDVNEPVFKVGDPRDRDRWRPIEQVNKQTRATVLIRNTTRYSARNPWVCIRLHGIAFEEAPAGWRATRTANTVFITELMWEGEIAHGDMPLPLPDFVLTDSYIMPVRHPTIEVTVVADGIKPVTEKLAVKALNTEEWEQHMKDRALRRKLTKDLDSLMRGPLGWKSDEGPAA